MSKAFTRESDDLPEPPVLQRQVSLLPPGAKNYVTPDGARKFQEDLDRLLDEEHDNIEGALAESDEKQRRQTRSLQTARLRQILESAEIVAPPKPPHAQVRFGAFVTVRDHGNSESQYRIVGIDEADAERDWISWRSPIARALLNAHVGQRVKIQLPDGEEELEIVGIAYE